MSGDVGDHHRIFAALTAQLTAYEKGEHLVGNGKRGRGEGSIYRRKDGRWVGQYEVGGKRRYVYSKTRKEAAGRLAKAVADGNDGLIFDSENLTLAGYRCAICGSGLRTPKGKPEVQSAHIYPKRLDGSDDVRNGICLCRRHHWAMDVGWISIADDYTILVREDLPDHDDYLFIADYEGEKIQLPWVAEAAPDAMYLQEHRKLMGFQ